MTLKHSAIFIILMVLIIVLSLQAQAELLLNEGALQNKAAQTCEATEDCVLVSQTCQTSCASLPLNRSHEQAFLEKRIQACGDGIKDLPVCHTNPPLHAACINNRCTIDYAFEHNSHDGDYRNKGFQGSYKTSEIPQ